MSRYLQAGCLVGLLIVTIPVSRPAAGPPGARLKTRGERTLAYAAAAREIWAIVADEAHKIANPSATMADQLMAITQRRRAHDASQAHGTDILPATENRGTKTRRISPAIESAIRSEIHRAEADRSMRIARAREASRAGLGVAAHGSGTTSPLSAELRSMIYDKVRGGVDPEYGRSSTLMEVSRQRSGRPALSKQLSPVEQRLWQVLRRALDNSFGSRGQPGPGPRDFRDAPYPFGNGLRRRGAASYEGGGGA